MSNLRYAEEFRETAVYQVLERGYPEEEVSERLGVPVLSLNEWVAAAKSSTQDDLASQLREARREIRRLRVSLQRAEKDRDFFERAAKYFAGHSG